jgi:hypothetical protein
MSDPVQQLAETIGDALGDIDAIKTMVLEIYKQVVPLGRRQEIAREAQAKRDSQS